MIFLHLFLTAKSSSLILCGFLLFFGAIINCHYAARHLRWLFLLSNIMTPKANDLMTVMSFALLSLV